MRLLLVGLGVAFLVSCQGMTPYNLNGSTDSGTPNSGGSGTDTQTGKSLDVNDVSPDYGTTAGGETVMITGGPFDSSARVYFDGTEATVENATSTKLTVTTPEVPVSSAGTVDVKVV